MSLRPYGISIFCCGEYVRGLFLRTVLKFYKNVNKPFISHESFFSLKDYKLPNLGWTFYVTWINLLLMKHKLINFHWIVNNLIVRNLLITYLNLIKESGQKQLLTEQMLFEVGVQRKTPVLQSVFDKVADLQFSC